MPNRVPSEPPIGIAKRPVLTSNRSAIGLADLAERVSKNRIFEIRNRPRKLRVWVARYKELCNVLRRYSDV